MRKEQLKIIFRFAILLGMHYCWLRMYVFFNAISQGLIYVSSDVKNFAIYYLHSWWTIPITALVVNLISVLFAKLMPIESKRISTFYWIISIMMTIALIMPYVIYVWAVVFMGA